ncbi:MAG: hypothetical protein ACRDPE_00395 [Solirubrobacterales bacterium]
MSAALDEWREACREVFDEIEPVQARVDRTPGGRRGLTAQINYAYAMLIAAHFQRFCRALHREAAEVLVAQMSDPALADVMEGLLAQDLRLDRGNPTARNLGVDFARFGFRFWDAVESRDRRNSHRKTELERLCEWRNAIVHGDVERKQMAGRLVPRDLELKDCTNWRQALGSLVDTFDEVLAARCEELGCAEPW